MRTQLQKSRRRERRGDEKQALLNQEASGRARGPREQGERRGSAHASAGTGAALNRLASICSY